MTYTLCFSPNNFLMFDIKRRSLFSISVIQPSIQPRLHLCCTDWLPQLLNEVRNYFIYDLFIKVEKNRKNFKCFVHLMSLILTNSNTYILYCSICFYSDLYYSNKLDCFSLCVVKLLYLTNDLCSSHPKKCFVFNFLISFLLINWNEFVSKVVLHGPYKYQKGTWFYDQRRSITNI
jgi:hypothetical protein